MTQLDIKPAFEVEVLEGTDTVVQTVWEDGKMAEKEIEVPKGWMVYFPSGHSCRVRKKGEMIRLGFLEGPSLIDMESGDEIANKPISLKETVRRKTKPRKHSAATSGITK